MLSRIFYALALVAITVAVHAAGLVLVLRFLVTHYREAPTRFWPTTRLLIGLVWALIVVHLASILVWGAFYAYQGCLPDAESAYYFAGVTYTTVGYGDLVLPKPWRLYGPVEGLTGILMCGLSTGFFFAVVNELFHPKSAAKRR
jgi:hypothetical protein